MRVVDPGRLTGQHVRADNLGESEHVVKRAILKYQDK